MDLLGIGILLWYDWGYFSRKADLFDEAVGEFGVCVLGGLWFVFFGFGECVGGVFEGVEGVSLGVFGEVDDERDMGGHLEYNKKRSKGGGVPQ